MRGGVSRREFLSLAVMAGAASAFGSGCSIRNFVDNSLPASFSPDAFLRIDSAGDVTIWITRQEMGQGVRTAFPMIIAEELDADWSSIRIIQAPLGEQYGAQRTGGSLSIREMMEPLRRTGATARAMLIRAAAEEWGVDPATLTTRRGRVHDSGRGRSLSYGELAGRASTLAVPPGITLKDPAEFTIIGRSRPQLDARDIVTGAAGYGIDRRLPGMLFASIERCPVIGGSLRSFDSSAALKIPGVKAVFPIDIRALSPMLPWANGVAVVAESSWTAQKARDALAIEWDEGDARRWNQPEIIAALEKRAGEPGTVTRDDGDFDDAIAGSAREITSDYLAPYLSHSPLETMNCTADVREDRCEVWAPCQFPNIAGTIAERITGLSSDRIKVNITLLGGGFGRRIYADYVGEAVMISKSVGAPVQLLWTRVDDTRHGFYRPISHHRLTATLNREGDLTGWRHRISGPSRSALRGPDVENPEQSEVYAANQLAYAIPSVRVEFNHHYIPIPCGPWRAVAYSQTGFVVESFIDEVAFACGLDPLAFRLKLLASAKSFTNDETFVDPVRMGNVLELAATKAGWSRNRRAQGRGRGLSVTTDHGTCVAHVADVSVSSEGRLKIERIVSAIDCGLVVNPGTVAAQVQGSIAFALSTLKSEITIDRGRVAQSSYADYDVVRMDEMPPVEVHIVPSDAAPGGVGEPPLPGVVPAVLNAIFAATGRRIRRIPIRAADLAAHA